MSLSKQQTSSSSGSLTHSSNSLKGDSVQYGIDITDLRVTGDRVTGSDRGQVRVTWHIMATIAVVEIKDDISI